MNKKSRSLACRKEGYKGNKLNFIPLRRAIALKSRSVNAATNKFEIDQNSIIIALYGVCVKRALKFN